MIDFRYHLVSLIAVFMALAVGIALGAGPLKDTVSDTLTGQVDQLREEKDALRAELDGTSADLAASERWADAAGAELLAGTMPGYRVAVVSLGADVPGEVRDAVDTRLAQAGATVTAHVSLAEAWTDSEQRSYRQSLVGFLVDYLDPAPPADAGVPTEMAYALVQGLVGADPTDPDALSEGAAALLDLLSTGDSPMVTVDGEVTVPADAIVVLAEPTQAPDEAADPTAAPTVDTEAQAAYLEVASAAQQLSDGAVLADGDPIDGSMTAALLADAERAAVVSSVSGTDEVFGQVSVPMALAARIGGTEGHFGVDGSATALPPRVELPEPDRSLLPDPTTPDPANPDQTAPATEPAAGAAATAGAGG